MILSGKAIAIIIGVVTIGGGAAGIALVGEVDWDEWLTFGNHHEDNKYNNQGDRFSVIHTDPGYNKEDGMYYAVSKCEISNREGRFGIMVSNGGNASVEEVDEGFEVTCNGRTVLFTEGSLEKHTIDRYAGIHGEYQKEMIERYGIEWEDGYNFDIRLKTDRHGSTYQLYLNKRGEHTLIDDDFDYRKTTMVADILFVSDDSKVEIQHISPSVEACLDEIYYTEKFLNDVCYNVVVIV